MQPKQQPRVTLTRNARFASTTHARLRPARYVTRKPSFYERATAWCMANAKYLLP